MQPTTTTCVPPLPAPRGRRLHPQVRCGALFVAIGLMNLSAGGCRWIADFSSTTDGGGGQELGLADGRPRDTPADDTPADDTPADDTPADDTPAWDATAWDATAWDATAWDATAWDATSHDTYAESALPDGVGPDAWVDGQTNPVDASSPESMGLDAITADPPSDPGWGVSLTSSNNTNPTFLSAVVVDAQDNIYVAGRIWGEAAVDGRALTSMGKTDIYVAKFSAKGMLLWQRGERVFDGRKPLQRPAFHDGTARPYAVARSTKAVVLVGGYGPLSNSSSSPCPNGVSLPTASGVDGFICSIPY